METVAGFDGLKIGHAQNHEAKTGCTVLLFEQGAQAGVDVRGGAPGTRETDLLDPVNMIEQIHAIALCGGSAFGLDAATGVMKYLEDKGIGFDTGFARVPIVPAAVIYDLGVGDPAVRPDQIMGIAACRAASEHNRKTGALGAGAGATVGKWAGNDQAAPGGVGICSAQIGPLKVLALMVVNCLGSVVDPESGEVIAGPNDMDQLFNSPFFGSSVQKFTGNTTIGAVVTNARLSKAQAKKAASLAHNGIAKTIRPAHTMADGDTIFAAATGEVTADMNLVGQLAADLTAGAILDAVKQK